MIVIISTALWLACTFLLCVFSFWVGRCARKLPIIDEKLPWTMCRDEASRCTGDCARERKRQRSAPSDRP